MFNIALRAFQPDENLKNIISEYYFIENQTISHEIIPPLGFPVIQFLVNGDINTFYSSYSFPISDVMIVGQLSKYAKIQAVENMSMIGVNLKPTALYKLTKSSASMFTDQGIPASNFWNESIQTVIKELANTDSDSKRLAVLNSFFSNLIQEESIEYDKFDLLIDEIIAKQGNITTEEIYNILPITTRTLQRLFRDKLGVSLKTYIRIIRNLNLFKELHTNPSKKFTDIIHDLGYYDYSHFVKDFKLMTGLTPKEYFSKREEFANILTQL